MKRCCSRAQWDHSTPRSPTTSAWVGEPITWGGQEAHGAGPSSSCVVGTGCPWVLPASICLFSHGAWCSVSSLGPLGRKLIPVLCLDGFPLFLIWFFNISQPSKTKCFVLHSAIRFGYQSPRGPHVPHIWMPLHLLHLNIPLWPGFVCCHPPNPSEPFQAFFAIPGNLSPTGMSPGSSLSSNPELVATVGIFCLVKEDAAA